MRRLALRLSDLTAAPIPAPFMADELSVFLSEHHYRQYWTCRHLQQSSSLWNLQVRRPEDNFARCRKRGLLHPVYGAMSSTISLIGAATRSRSFARSIMWGFRMGGPRPCLRIAY